MGLARLALLLKSLGVAVPEELGIGRGLSYPLLCSDCKHSGGQWGVECLSV